MDHSEVHRHVRQFEDPAERDRLRDLPPFERKPKGYVPTELLNMSALCVCCRRRRGLHRVMTEACPNPNWRVGNDQAQFLASTFTRGAVL